MLFRFLSVAGFLLSTLPAFAEEPGGSRPNVLVVMVDDLGFSDIGCYGGEIETPVLNRLASQGLRFTQFYNTAKCHSSRVSLLSGEYCIQAGDIGLTRAVTSAEVLKQAGYMTLMTGKWHLSGQPTDFGFDRYFGHLSGATNYFSGDKTFRLNGKPWKVPEKDFYATTADVDFALDFLAEAREAKKPWYLYVAFNAPHAPLQPLEEDYRKYEGRYDAGWDVIHKERLARQKELGLFNQTIEPAQRPPGVPEWEELSEIWADFEPRRMTAIAGLVDRIDQEIGRLVADLEKAGELENTFILFVSDNGACPYERRCNKIDQLPCTADVTWNDSTGWAWMRNAPFRYYKQNQYEGGICTPAIVHWPAGLKARAGSITRSPVHLIDVLPTLSDICQAPIPTTWPGRKVKPVSGVSLRPILETGKMASRPPIHLLFSSDRGLRDGDWKLVSFRREPWELYNLANDRTEQHNLADKHPERLQKMIAQWHTLARDVLEVKPKTAQPVKEAASPHQHPQWTDYDGVPRSSIGVQAAKKR